MKCIVFGLISLSLVFLKMIGLITLGWLGCFLPFIIFISLLTGMTIALISVLHEGSRVVGKGKFMKIMFKAYRP
jgi:hypothetical protein